MGTGDNVKILPKTESKSSSDSDSNVLLQAERMNEMIKSPYKIGNSTMKTFLVKQYSKKQNYLHNFAHIYILEGCPYDRLRQLVKEYPEENVSKTITKKFGPFRKNTPINKLIVQLTVSNNRKNVIKEINERLPYLDRSQQKRIINALFDCGLKSAAKIAINAVVQNDLWSSDYEDKFIEVLDTSGNKNTASYKYFINHASDECLERNAKALPKIELAKRGLCNLRKSECTILEYFDFIASCDESDSIEMHSLIWTMIHQYAVSGQYRNLNNKHTFAPSIVSIPDIQEVLRILSLKKLEHEIEWILLQDNDLRNIIKESPEWKEVEDLPLLGNDEQQVLVMEGYYSSLSRIVREAYQLVDISDFQENPSASTNHSDDDLPF